jgi:hypothetical protein
VTEAGEIRVYEYVYEYGRSLCRHAAFFLPYSYTYSYTPISFSLTGNLSVNTEIPRGLCL